MILFDGKQPERRNYHVVSVRVARGQLLTFSNLRCSRMFSRRVGASLTATWRHRPDRCYIQLHHTADLFPTGDGNCTSLSTMNYYEDLTSQCTGKRIYSPQFFFLGPSEFGTTDTVSYNEMERSGVGHTLLLPFCTVYVVRRALYPPARRETRMRRVSIGVKTARIRKRLIRRQETPAHLVRSLLVLEMSKLSTPALFLCSHEAIRSAAEMR